MAVTRLPLDIAAFRISMALPDCVRIASTLAIGFGKIFFNRPAGVETEPLPAH
jgi:hypothetical protein